MTGPKVTSRSDASHLRTFDDCSSVLDRRIVPVRGGSGRPAAVLPEPLKCIAGNHVSCLSEAKHLFPVGAETLRFAQERQLKALLVFQMGLDI